MNMLIVACDISIEKPMNILEVRESWDVGFDHLSIEPRRVEA